MTHDSSLKVLRKGSYYPGDIPWQAENTDHITCGVCGLLMIKETNGIYDYYNCPVCSCPY